jgi:hypothetical protein
MRGSSPAATCLTQWETEAKAAEEAKKATTAPTAAPAETQAETPTTAPEPAKPLIQESSAAPLVLAAALALYA